MVTKDQREFAERIRKLFGDPFQLAIYTALSATFLDTQAITTRPSGDGGVDVLTDKLTIAHCCYGLDPTTVKTNSKATVKGYVVKKFSGDLMRILELESKGKTYIHKGNDELSGIMPAGTKFKLIRLVCNYFEDNTIIGKLNEKYQGLHAASQRKFVTDSCAINFLGPDQISGLCVIDQSVMVRVCYPELAKIIDSVDKTQTMLPPVQSDFDAKFDHFLAKVGAKAHAVNELRNEFRGQWNTALLVMQKLEADYPGVHQKLEVIVHRCATQAKVESMGSTALVPVEMVARYSTLLRETIASELSDQLPPGLINSLAEIHVAKLIGDCPIDWRD